MQEGRVKQADKATRVPQHCCIATCRSQSCCIGCSEACNNAPIRKAFQSRHLCWAGQRWPHVILVLGSVALGLNASVAGLTAASAEQQTDDTVSMDMSEAAKWNEDMANMRSLWKRLGLAHARVLYPLESLVRLFLSGEGAHGPA